MSPPNKNPAPRGESPQPSISSGSDQRRLAHRAFVGNLLLAIEQPDLIDVVDQRAEAAVNAEDCAGRVA
jgi:hypothetical protein